MVQRMIGKKHYNYLLPFFKDERYIKKRQQTGFFLYFSQEMILKHSKKMTIYWNELAKKDGFDGIYFFEQR